MSLFLRNKLPDVNRIGETMTVSAIKKQLLSVSVLITLGLSGCSDPTLNSEASLVSGSVSQAVQPGATSES